MEFSPTIVAKLRERAERYRELNELISSPEIASDGKRLPALLREQGQLQESERLFGELEKLLSRREEAAGMVDDEDEDMRALAQEELEGLEAEELALDEAIKGS